MKSKFKLLLTIGIMIMSISSFADKGRDSDGGFAYTRSQELLKKAADELVMVIEKVSFSAIEECDNPAEVRDILLQVLKYENIGQLPNEDHYRNIDGEEVLISYDYQIDEPKIFVLRGYFDAFAGTAESEFDTKVVEVKRRLLHEASHIWDYREPEARKFSYSMISELTNPLYILENYNQRYSEEIQEERNLSKELRRQKRNKRNHSKFILKCSRSIIEKKLGGTLGVEKVIEYLTDLKANKNNVEKLKKIANSCALAKKTLKRQKKVTRVEQEEVILERFDLTRPHIGNSVTKMIKNFLYPVVKCTEGGLSAGGGFIVTVGATIESGFCKASNGKRWMQFSTGIGVGGGLGAYTVFRWDETEEKKNINSPIYFTGDEMVTISAAIAAAQTNGYGLDDIFDISLNDAEIRGDKHGFGMGIGDSGQFFGTIKLKLIPLGTDWEKMLKKL